MNGKSTKFPTQHPKFHYTLIKCVATLTLKWKLSKVIQIAQKRYHVCETLMLRLYCIFALFFASFELLYIGVGTKSTENNKSKKQQNHVKPDKILSAKLL